MPTRHLAEESFLLDLPPFLLESLPRIHFGGDPGRTIWQNGVLLNRKGKFVVHTDKPT